MDRLRLNARKALLLILFVLYRKSEAQSDALPPLFRLGLFVKDAGRQFDIWNTAHIMHQDLSGSRTFEYLSGGR
jgi:hypothetical protein